MCLTIRMLRRFFSRKIYSYSPWIWLGEFVFIAMAVVAFLPLFVKRGFWEEWGWAESGESWGSGGVTVYRDYFLEAINSPYLDFWNGVLNVVLLGAYSVILVLALNLLLHLARRLRKP